MDRAEFDQPVQTLAPALLGALLVRQPDQPGQPRRIARIVETEAYHQSEPACHAHRGRTRANAGLFGPPGHAYVYFTYGMHFCLNASCGDGATAAGVLFRAAQIIEGQDLARQRRPAARRNADLARGPARLTAALDVGQAFNGADLCDAAGRLHLARDDQPHRPERIAAGPRTGVRLAWQTPWRFYLKDCAEVSPYRRHPKASR